MILEISAKPVQTAQQTEGKKSTCGTVSTAIGIQRLNEKKRSATTPEEKRQKSTFQQSERQKSTFQQSKKDRKSLFNKAKDRNALFNKALTTEVLGQDKTVRFSGDKDR